MRFAKELYRLFSLDELVFITKEATIVYENDSDEIDYLLWMRDSFYAEIRVEKEKQPKITKLDDEKQTDFKKEEFLKMLKGSKSSRLSYLEVK